MKRTSLKRGKGLKRKKPSYYKDQADTLWSKIIRMKPCAIRNGHCGGGLNAHHLISRSVVATRHKLENGICLCASHHMLSSRLSAHGAPLAFADWLEAHRPEQFAWQRAHRNDSGRPDYVAVCEELRAKIEAMGGSVE